MQTQIKASALQKYPGPNAVVVTDAQGNITVPTGVELTVSGKVTLPAKTFMYVDPRLPPYNMPEDTTDALPYLNQIRADITAAVTNPLSNIKFGTIYLPFKLPVSGQFVHEDYINLEGAHETESGFILTNPTACIPSVLSSIPTVGRTDGSLAQTYNHFTVEAGSIGRTVGTGTVTLDSNLVTSVTWEGSGFVPFGYIIEGVGIPPRTTVVSHDTNGIVMSRNAEGNNTGPSLSLNRLMFRECVTRQATSVADSAVLTVVDTTGIKVGMRTYGDNLEPDEEDPGLNQWSRVIAVTPTTVTLDRPAKQAGLFTMWSWVEIDGIRFERADIAPGYTSGRDYAGCKMTRVRIRKVSGTGVVGRPRRHQINLDRCKVDATGAGGVDFTACNDSWLERSGVGSTWKDAVRFTTMATPRMSGEAWLPYMVDKHQAISFNLVKECQLTGCDVNGPIRFTGKDTNLKPIVTVVGLTSKWFRVNNNPDPTKIQAYIEAQNVHVNVIGAGFMWNQEGRPHHIMRSIGGGTMTLIGSSFITDPTNPECPFSVSIADNPLRFNMLMTDGMSKTLTMGSGTWTPTITCATLGDLSVAYAAQEGYYAMLPGGLMHVGATLEFTPTFTTAAGEFRVTGLSTILAGFTLPAEQMVPAASESVNTNWGVGMTQFNAALKDSGSMVIKRTGSAKTATVATIGNFTSGLPHRFTISGVIRYI